MHFGLNSGENNSRQPIKEIYVKDKVFVILDRPSNPGSRFLHISYISRGWLQSFLRLVMKARGAADNRSSVSNSLRFFEMIFL